MADTKRWRKVASMKFKRSAVGAVAMSDHLYVCGVMLLHSQKTCWVCRQLYFLCPLLGVWWHFQLEHSGALRPSRGHVVRGCQYDKIPVSRWSCAALRKDLRSGRSQRPLNLWVSWMLWPRYRGHLKHTLLCAFLVVGINKTRHKKTYALARVTK